MKFPKGRIKRVFLEFEDGTAELIGRDAEEWREMAKGQAMIAYVHGSTWPNPNWIVRLKESRNEEE